MNNIFPPALVNGRLAIGVDVGWIGTGLFGDGTAAAPSISFQNEPTLGFFRLGAGILGFGSGGSASLYFGPGGAIYNPNGTLTISLNSTGSIALSASGTNQKITLTPSGTGTVQIGSASGSLLLVGTGTDSANGAIQLATHTTVAGGIGFGTETSLYRTGAGVVRLDHIGGTLPVLEIAEGSAIKGRLFSSGGAVYLESYTSATLNLRTNQTLALSIGTDQVATFTQFIMWAGQKRVSSQFDKTNDTTLANVTGLSVNVAAGKTYTFRADLIISCNSSGGVKVAIAGTATATNVAYVYTSFVGSSNPTAGNATALGTALGATHASVRVQIAGTIVVNAGGTLTVQFAQNASFGTASSVLVGSYFEVQQIA